METSADLEQAADASEEFDRPGGWPGDARECPQRWPAVPALQLSERRRHHIANPLAESHIAGMQPADAIAFTEVLDFDRWLHHLNDVGEGVFKSPEDIDRKKKQRQTNCG